MYGTGSKSTKLSDSCSAAGTSVDGVFSGTTIWATKCRLAKTSSVQPPLNSQSDTCLSSRTQRTRIHHQQPLPRTPRLVIPESDLPHSDARYWCFNLNHLGQFRLVLIITDNILKITYLILTYQVILSSFHRSFFHFISLV